MSLRLPFSKLIHHPSNNTLFLSCGQHLQALDSTTGTLLASTIPPTAAEGIKPATPLPQISSTLDNVHSGIIRTLVVSNDGKYLATSGEDKTLKVWNPETLDCVNSRPAIKRAMALQFTNDGERIILADKFGDVFSHETVKTDGETNLLMGHVSMLFDMALSYDIEYIITADRDEKIRVSKYPKAYVIENYCLGHTELVSKILVPSFAPQSLISGGGDKFLLLWDWTKAEIKQKIDLFECFGMTSEDAHPSLQKPIVTEIIQSPTQTHIAVTFEKYPGVLILNLDNGILSVFTKLQLPRDPLAACFDLKGCLWVALSTETEAETQSSNTQLLELFELDNDTYTRVHETDSRISTINQSGSTLVESMPDIYPFGPLRKDIKSWLKGDFPDSNDREEGEDEDEAEGEPSRKKMKRGRKKKTV